MRVIKSEEERHVMERKVAETEVIVHRMVEEAERRQHEAETLRKEVSKAREAEKEAKGKLIEFLNTSMTDVSKSSPTWHGNTAITPALAHNGEETRTPDDCLYDCAAGNTRQLITPAGGLNLTMDELTHSAYDLTSGVTRYK